MIYWWQCKRKIRKWYRSFRNAMYHLRLALRPSNIMAWIKRNMPSERRRRKEIDRIIEKGAAGVKLTPEEREFLHHEAMSYEIKSRNECAKLQKELSERQQKYGPCTIVVYGDVDPETGREYPPGEFLVLGGRTSSERRC